MKTLYVILGALMVWMGGTALYDDTKLYRILFPAIALAAVFIFNAFRTRNKLEVIASVGAVMIAAAYATGFFHPGQAMGWAAGWMLVSGIFWIATGIMAPQKPEDLLKIVAIRSRKNPLSAEDPFTGGNRATVKEAEFSEAPVPAPVVAAAVAVPAPPPPAPVVPAGI